MRSADRPTPVRRAGAAVAAAGAVVALGGCATTQQEASRLQLNAARIRAAEQPTVVRSAGSAVEVSDVSMLSSSGAHTFVVTVRNQRPTAVSDLPISVGVIGRGHRRIYLNERSTQELSYFDAHLPRIAAGGSATWVFTSRRPVSSRVRPFVLIGGRPSPAAPAGSSSAPSIASRVTATRARPDHRAVLDVELRNGSTIPQYQLPVYAVAVRRSHIVAAGVLVVPHLGSRRTLSIHVPVQGSLAGARLHVAALPTIVH